MVPYEPFGGLFQAAAAHDRLQEPPETATRKKTVLEIREIDHLTQKLFCRVPSPARHLVSVLGGEKYQLPDFEKTITPIPGIRLMSSSGIWPNPSQLHIDQSQ